MIGCDQLDRGASLKPDYIFTVQCDAALRTVRLTT
jgi:hypothetical protein